MKRGRRRRQPKKERRGFLRGLAALALVTAALRLFLHSPAADTLEAAIGGRAGGDGLAAALCFELGVPVAAAASPPEEPSTQQLPRVLTVEAPPSNAPEETAELPEEAEAPSETQAGGEPSELPPLVYDPALIDINDHTSLGVSAAAYLAKPYQPSLAEEGPSVLIIHTHGSEAYAPTEENAYVPSDPERTEDKSCNVVRVGDLLAEKLEAAGVRTIHDRELYDYPTYTGSYSRSLAAIEAHLEEYPGISVVLDIHRDSAQRPDGASHSTSVTLGGESCSQVMLVVGTGEGGLYHPGWEENFRFALELQTVMENRYPGLARGVDLRVERFNQHATPGSLIVEIGYSGNTLEQSLNAAERFAACLTETLCKSENSS